MDELLEWTLGANEKPTASDGLRRDSVGTSIPPFRTVHPKLELDLEGGEERNTNERVSCFPLLGGLNTETTDGFRISNSEGFSWVTRLSERGRMSDHWNGWMGPEV